MPKAFFSLLVTLLSGCAVVTVPFSSEERAELTLEDQRRITQLSYLGPNPILDLSDVIARAVVFNRDRELASLEARLAGLDTSEAYLDQLPSLTSRLSYSERSNTPGSTSSDIVDGVVQPIGDSPSFSTSSDKATRSGDITLAFSVLDFGLAYGRAEQIGDQFLIAQEKERQALFTIYQQAQAAYWRAVAADRLQFELSALLLRTQEAYQRYVEIQRENLRDPLQTLTFQRELLDVERTLRDLKRDLATARTELDTLIGVRPGTQYTLRDTVDPRFPLPTKMPELDSLEALALLNRTDIAENLYQARILESERENLLLQLLPNFNVSASYNRDFSPYQLNEESTRLGADLSWDFMNLFRVQPTRVRIELRERLLQEQRLQITLAALALVQQTEDLLNQNMDRFELSKRYESVTGGVLAQVTASAEAQRGGSLSVIKEELNFLVARHRSDLAYSDVHASFGQMVSAAGLDLIPADWEALSVNELASVIEKRRRVFFAEPKPTVEEFADEAPESQPEAAKPIPDIEDQAAIAPEPAPISTSEPKKLWALQIASFKPREVALRFKQELEAAGWESLYIVTHGSMHKLRQGPTSERAVARSAKAELKARYGLDGLVIKTKG